MKTTMFLIITSLLLCQLGSAYYSGYSYGLNHSRYDKLIAGIPKEYFNKLTNIQFTDSTCIITRFEWNPDGYTTQCSTGVFEYWINGRTTIRIGRIDDDQQLNYTLWHELGHLDQWRMIGGVNMSRIPLPELQVGADRFAGIK
jgi:hypothetical protein